MHRSLANSSSVGIQRDTGLYNRHNKLACAFVACLLQAANVYTGHRNVVCTRVYRMARAVGLLLYAPYRASIRRDIDMTVVAQPTVDGYCHYVCV